MVKTDSEIIELFFKRDETAISSTEEKYGAYCGRVAFDILDCSQDTEECLNETWYRAWISIPPKHPDNLRLFLARITRNLAINRYEVTHAGKRGGGETAFVLDELEEIIAGADSVEDACDANALQEFIHDFTAKLSKRDAGIFARRYFYSESTAKIADRYDLSESNIRMILSRLRRKLRKELIKEGMI